MTDQAEDVAQEIVREVDRDWDTFENRTDDLPESEWPPAALQLVTAIASAIRSAEPQWRYDMENAPRDGTPVLLFAPDAIEPKIFIGFWTEFADQTGAVVDQHWTDFGTEQEFDVELTHWMPLPASPAPPEAISGKEG